MNNLLTEIRNSGMEMKKAFEVDWMLRRYQKSLHGETDFGDLLVKKYQLCKQILKSSWRSIIKRGLDLTCSSLGIVLALPLMAVIAALIKLDSPGSSIYSQTRVGRHGRFFKMYKFRSMRPDAEIGSGPVWAQKNDNRVTRIGAFLRTSHLDELPQIFNVFKGEMSFVGPRPERPHFVDQFRLSIPGYDKRLEAKPGITGLAQIKRSYDETLADVKNKLRYDRLYVKKMCPFLDVKVMLLTVGTVVFRTGR